MHKLCQASAERILTDFKPNLIIAIGGGGYVPARILRYSVKHMLASPHRLHTNIASSFLKRPGSPNIPIQAIGLSLYEELPPKHDADGKVNVEKDVEQPGTKVTRTQWLDLSSLEMANLIGKNILIVDEVDDTRTTLEYAVKELMKDVELARQTAGKTGDEGKTRFSIFVLHVSDAPWSASTCGTDGAPQNKDKAKRGHLPVDMLDMNRYLAAVTVPGMFYPSCSATHLLIFPLSQTSGCAIPGKQREYPANPSVAQV